MSIVSFAADPDIKNRLAEDAKRARSTTSAILRQIVYSHYAREGVLPVEPREKVPYNATSSVSNAFPEQGSTPPSP